MAVHFLAAHIAAQRLFEVVTLLLPLTPLPLLLVLESWVVSKYEFSRGEAVLFRMAYVISLLASCCATIALVAIYWR